jgi:hypothetical protein
MGDIKHSTVEMPTNELGAALWRETRQSPLQQRSGWRQFDCFIADQPDYLVPVRLLPEGWERGSRGSQIVNPEVSFSWRGSVPKAVAACYPLPAGFLANSGIVWVNDNPYKTPTPFWAGPKFQGSMSSLIPGEPVPAGLSQRVSSLLSLARVFVDADGSAQEYALWSRRLALPTQEFRRREYAALDRLFHPFHIGSLRRYFRGLLRGGGMKLGDNGSPQRYVVHNDSVASFFHRHLAPLVSAVAGVRVKPSYVYVASYRSGANLAAHTDRVQCEYSVSTLIDYTPEPVDQSPWPLYLEPPTGQVAVWQGIGDSLLYRGRNIPHYRARLPDGETSTSIFFHYVDWNFSGPLD